MLPPTTKMGRSCWRTAQAPSRPSGPSAAKKPETAQRYRTSPPARSSCTEAANCVRRHGCEIEEALASCSRHGLGYSFRFGGRAVEERDHDAFCRLQGLGHSISQLAAARAHHERARAVRRKEGSRHLGLDEAHPQLSEPQVGERRRRRTDRNGGLRDVVVEGRRVVVSGERPSDFEPLLEHQYPGARASQVRRTGQPVGSGSEDEDVVLTSVHVTTSVLLLRAPWAPATVRCCPGTTPPAGRTTTAGCAHPGPRPPPGLRCIQRPSR